MIIANKAIKAIGKAGCTAGLLIFGLWLSFIFFRNLYPILLASAPNNFFAVLVMLVYAMLYALPALFSVVTINSTLELLKPFFIGFIIYIFLDLYVVLAQNGFKFWFGINNLNYNFLSYVALVAIFGGLIFANYRKYWVAKVVIYQKQGFYRVEEGVKEDFCQPVSEHYLFIKEQNKFYKITESDARFIKAEAQKFILFELTSEQDYSVLSLELEQGFPATRGLKTLYSYFILVPSSIYHNVQLYLRKKGVKIRL